MKVYIASSGPGDHYKVEDLLDLLARSREQRHSVTLDPVQADVVLVPFPAYTYRHERQLLWGHLDKCFAIDDTDEPLLVIPGLYASAPRGVVLQRKRVRGCGYFSNRRIENPFVRTAPEPVGKEYLVSFLGNSTSWVRKRLLRMKLTRPDILIKSSAGRYAHWGASKPGREEMQQAYVDLIRRSKFALCPRGAGAGSIRVFEVMRLGVAPIIVSDDWLPPSGPDWKSFALFLPERQIARLAELAERHEPEFAERGRLARRAWEEYFADELVFNRNLEMIEELRTNRSATLDRVILAFYWLPMFLRGVVSAARKTGRAVVLAVFRVLKIPLPFELGQ